MVLVCVLWSLARGRDEVDRTDNSAWKKSFAIKPLVLRCITVFRRLRSESHPIKSILGPATDAMGLKLMNFPHL